MKTAIITGASAGLGREYVAHTVKMFPSLECIWLIARREDVLKEIAAEYPNKKFKILPLDLTNKEELALLKTALAEEQPDVKLLINNAGVGKLGNIAECDAENQTKMVDLNCRALTFAVSVTLPYMKRGSNIINIASIAAFAPTPRMTVYSATKAFVYAYSAGLQAELREHGINVTAVCPGPMATEFLARADIVGNSKAFKILPYCSPAETAKNSLIAARHGHAVYTDRTVYKFYRVLSKMMPNRLLVHLTRV